MNYKLFNKGFTLIELMVVVAIIAILTAIVTSNFAASKQKARDTKRISDIAQLQLTLEQLFDRCNKYPTDNSDSLPAIDSIICTVDGTNYTLNSFISKIPTDPTNSGSYVYRYYTASSGTILDYVLRATLETNNPALSDDIDTDSPSGIDVGVGGCADTTSRYYCVQPR